MLRCLRRARVSIAMQMYQTKALKAQRSNSTIERDISGL
jgi:hypothetical protein